jgi:hypothetical protein
VPAKPSDVHEGNDGENDEHLDGLEQALGQEDALVEVLFGLPCPDSGACLLGFNVPAQSYKVSHSLALLGSQLATELGLGLLVYVRVLLKVGRDLHLARILALQGGSFVN